MMKKLIICVLAFLLCFFAVSCSHTNNKENNNIDSNQNHKTETTQKHTENSTEIVKDIDATKHISETAIPSKNNDDIGGGEILPRKYRNNYYQIPAFFANIVDDVVFDTWEKEYYLNNYPDNTNVMVMVDFIKEFNISKEDFEKANLEYAYFIDEIYSHICLQPQDYADQEMQEIYNADIIYTFDNATINEYYLGIDYPFLNEYQYDDAIANGTYETRTTDFIDIEQMEAEIIAKYGEAEIVTEQETTTAEAVTTDLLQTETIE